MSFYYIFFVMLDPFYVLSFCRSPTLSDRFCERVSYKTSLLIRMLFRVGARTPRARDRQLHWILINLTPKCLLISHYFSLQFLFVVLLILATFQII
jgi:hypothetical protein